MARRLVRRIMVQTTIPVLNQEEGTRPSKANSDLKGASAGEQAGEFKERAVFIRATSKL